MEDKLEVVQLQDALVDAFEWGENERLSALVSQFAALPRQGRAVLEDMLASPDASPRRAAVFALGELGGAASVKRLEQQMALEEARGDRDGESVLEVITQALGRIKESAARASLIRRLKRLTAGKPGQTDVNEVVYALWRKRHPELIPVVRRTLEQFPTEAFLSLNALLLLLETSPQGLAAWVLDASVPLEYKMNVLTILDEEVPDELLPALPAFISTGNALEEAALHRKEGDAAYYCSRLFTTLLLHLDRVLPALPPQTRSDLRTLARRCVAARVPNCSLRAARMLGWVGRPEDMLLLEAHRPADPGLAQVYDDAAQALRTSPNH